MAEIGHRLGCLRCGASWIASAGRLAGSGPLAKDGRRFAAGNCAVRWSVSLHCRVAGIPVDAEGAVAHGFKNAEAVELA